MIIVKLAGGLGNQMFQYAAGRSLAVVHNVPLKLDCAWYGESPSPLTTPRAYALHHFGIRKSEATPEEIAAVRHPWGSGLWGRLQARREGRRPPWRRRWYCQESATVFDPNFFRAGPDVYLDGYWQSEKHFTPIADDIRRIFTLRRPLSGRNREAAEAVAQCESVALHVRRKDYVTNPLIHQVFVVCGREYYEAAAARIQTRVTDPVFFVFSDDPVWCRENLRLPATTKFVDWNTADQDVEDLRLMSLCRHNIIANSSFSWWGAWLNRNSDKIVIAPRRWFRDPTVPTIDLIPAGWERL